MEGGSPIHPLLAEFARNEDRIPERALYLKFVKVIKALASQANESGLTELFKAAAGARPLGGNGHGSGGTGMGRWAVE